NRLFEALETGAWDGRDLDSELAHRDGLDRVHYVFCPVDPRFTVRSDGSLDLADREPITPLSPAQREELDALGPALIERWRAEGPRPWTVRQVAEALGALGWSSAAQRGGWLLARTWLRDWPN